MNRASELVSELELRCERLEAELAEQQRISDQRLADMFDKHQARIQALEAVREAADRLECCPFSDPRFFDLRDALRDALRAAPRPEKPPEPADRAGPDVGTLVERISKLERRVYRLEADGGKC